MEKWKYTVLHKNRFSKNLQPKTKKIYSLYPNFNRVAGQLWSILMKSSKNTQRYHFFLNFQNCYFALYIWITFLRQNIFKSPLKWQSMVKICEVIIFTLQGGNYDNCSKNSENEITEEIFWLKMVQICSLNITVMFLQNIIEFQYFFQKLSHLPH